MPPITTPTLSVTGTAAHSISFGELSPVRNYEVTSGNCKVDIVTITNAIGGITDLYANITFTYTLHDDRAGLASLKCLYSTTGESGAYSEMTEYTGGSSDGKNDLTTSAAGTTHTFDWATVTDLGIDFKGTVYVKFRAFDRVDFIGDTMESGIRPILINNAPLAGVIVMPIEDFFDKNTTPQIVGTIPDPKSGNSDLHIKLEIARDEGFTDIELTLESAVDQIGWEYDTSGSGGWVDLPVSGIPVSSTPALIGRQWRVTVATDSELTTGQKYLRFSAGGILV